MPPTRGERPERSGFRHGQGVERHCPPEGEGVENTMLDAIYLGIGFAFLAINVFYVVACDRL